MVDSDGLTGSADIGGREDPYTIKAKKGTTADGVRMRSQLELRWAGWLDDCGIPWLYEEVQVAGVAYLPDFYVPFNVEEGLFIEIKPARWEGFPNIPRDWMLKMAKLVRQTGKDGYIMFGEPDVDMQALHVKVVGSKIEMDLIPLTECVRAWRA